MIDGCTTYSGFVAALSEIEGLSDDDRLVLAPGIPGMAEATGRHWIAVTRAAMSTPLPGGSPILPGSTSGADAPTNRATRGPGLFVGSSG